MSVKINSTGGGSVTLDSGSTANNVTLSLPGTAGTVAALASVTNNGVAYINSSGQPTSGSALTFDGTNLSAASTAQNLGTTSSRWGTVYATALSDGSDQLVGSYGYTARFGFGTAWNSQAFAISGTEQMRLTSTGLGIGTSSPSQKLTVSAAASGDIMQLLTQASSGQGWKFGIDTTNGLMYCKSNTSTYKYAWQDTVGTNLMLLNTSAGNLGLGITPSAVVSDFKGIEVGSAGNGVFGGIGGYANTMLSSNAYPSGASVACTYGSNGYAAQYRILSGSHYWLTAGSGTAGNPITFTQAMMLDASGSLGVGVTPSGTFKLEVGGSASFAGNTQLSAGYFRTVDGGSASLPSIQPGNDADTGMYWVGTNRLGFTTAGVNRLEINATGQLIHHSDTTSSYNVYLYGDNTDPYGLRIHYPNATPNSTVNHFLLGSDATATRFYMRSNGGLANYSANNTSLSDRREKTDFEPSGDYLDKLCQIPVQKFSFIDQSENDPGKTLGVVAQDVEAVCPELVAETDWSNGDEASESKMRLSIYQTDMQYAMLRAIQELKAIVDAQAVEIAALKAK